MRTVLPALYPALSGLRAMLAPRVWLFSTEIASVSLTELARGIALTTGGTDIAAVTGHLVEQRVRRALIVTDGWVGSVPAAQLEALQHRRVKLAVALTAGGDPSFAAPLGCRIVQLPDLD
jgi:hypothetical protein